MMQEQLQNLQGSFKVEDWTVAIILFTGVTEWRLIDVN